MCYCLFLFGIGLCYYLNMFCLLFMQSSHGNWGLIMMHFLEYYSFYNVFSCMSVLRVCFVDLGVSFEVEFYLDFVHCYLLCIFPNQVLISNFMYLGTTLQSLQSMHISIFAFNQRCSSSRLILYLDFPIIFS
jgi:hypothetical protein